jgi:UAA transporter family
VRVHCEAALGWLFDTEKKAESSMTDIESNNSRELRTPKSPGIMVPRARKTPAHDKAYAENVPLLKNTHTAIAALPSKLSGSVLIAGVFFFFGCHNYLQERIMSFEGFRFGWYLGLLEVVGVTVCTAAERTCTGDNSQKAPLRHYLGLTACLMASSSLSNIALNYINYPTKGESSLC